jgi:DNA-binding transcriptional regulator PaaX
MSDPGISETKQAIYKSLQRIGENGYSGIDCIGSSSLKAFLILMSGTIKNEPSATRAYRELMRQRLIEVEHLGDTHYRLKITPNGAYRLMKLTIDALYIDHMKPWDKKWRVVCFDIPKGKDKERLYLNRRLHELGFTLLQRSMWIHPYDCFETMKQIVDFCNLSRYVTILEVVHLDSFTRNKMEKHYGLSS